MIATQGIEKEDIMKMVTDMIEEGIAKKDRYFTLYFGESGMSVNVYPLTEDEEFEVVK